MSQIFKTLTSGGPIPPIIATSFTPDSGGAQQPQSNNLNVPGGSSTANNNNGITTIGTLGTITTTLTNRATGTAATPAAALTTIITLPLGATPGTYYLSGNVQAFNSSTPAGGSYGFSGAVRTTGGAATLISAAYHDEFEEPALAAADIFLNVSGNNALLQVQGDALLSINWNALLEYRMVT